MSFKPLIVDLSHHNNVTSYVDMKKAGIIGIIHKATQGTNYVDARYALRIKRARETGLLVGAYHFATSDKVEDQVSHFLHTVGSDKDVLLCLDFEPNTTGGSMSLRQARDWLELVKEKTGQLAVIYSGSMMKETLGNKKDEMLAKHKLWLCQYGPKAKVPANWDNFWLHQYAADGEGPQPRKVAGIDDYPDLNRHYADDPVLLKKEWLDIIKGT